MGFLLKVPLFYFIEWLPSAFGCPFIIHISVHRFSILYKSPRSFPVAEEKLIFKNIEKINTCQHKKQFIRWKWGLSFDIRRTSADDRGVCNIQPQILLTVFTLHYFIGLVGVGSIFKVGGQDLKSFLLVLSLKDSCLT